MRPKRRPAATCSGITARAKHCAALHKGSQQSSSSSSTLTCSHVAPDGPAAAPLRALSKLVLNFAASTASGAGAWKSSQGGKGTRRLWGRLAGCHNSATVSSVAGAKGAASNAELAADNSPRCASAAARSARLWASFSALLTGRRCRRAAPWAEAACADAASNSPHCCWARRSTRRANSAGGMCVWPGDAR